MNEKHVYVYLTSVKTDVYYCLSISSGVVSKTSLISIHDRSEVCKDVTDHTLG